MKLPCLVSGITIISTVAISEAFNIVTDRLHNCAYKLRVYIHCPHTNSRQVAHTMAVHLHMWDICEYPGSYVHEQRLSLLFLELCCPLPFLLGYLAASCTWESDPRTLPPSESTWQHAMHGGINVDILQVLQGLCVEEAKGGPRGEGNPNANASHSHVGDDHPFVLVGLQLILRKQRK